MVLVTIVIQNRNYAKWLERCIKSILAVDFPKDQYEIIGLDADSTDNSVEIYKKYPNVKLLQVGMVSQAEALNKALNVMDENSKFFCFVNADDYYLPNFISSHLNAFKDGVVLAFSRALLRREDRAMGKHAVTPCYSLNYPKRELLDWNFIMQPATMMRRTALDKVGGFNEGFSCAFDYYLWCALARVGDFAFVDEVTTVYSVRPSSMSNTSKDLENREACLIRDHFRGVL